MYHIQSAEIISVICQYPIPWLILPKRHLILALSFSAICCPMPQAKSKFSSKQNQFWHLGIAFFLQPNIKSYIAAQMNSVKIIWYQAWHVMYWRNWTCLVQFSSLTVLLHLLSQNIYFHIGKCCILQPSHLPVTDALGYCHIILFKGTLRILFFFQGLFFF